MICPLSNETEDEQTIGLKLMNKSERTLLEGKSRRALEKIDDFLAIHRKSSFKSNIVHHCKDENQEAMIKLSVAVASVYSERYFGLKVATDPIYRTNKRRNTEVEVDDQNPSNNLLQNVNGERNVRTKKQRSDESSTHSK
jgi:hypothetical protein